MLKCMAHLWENSKHNQIQKAEILRNLVSLVRVRPAQHLSWGDSLHDRYIIFLYLPPVRACAVVCACACGGMHVACALQSLGAKAQEYYDFLIPVLQQNVDVSSDESLAVLEVIFAYYYYY